MPSAKANKNHSSATNTWNKGIYSALKILFHFIAAFQFWYALYYDFSHVIIPPTYNRAFGGFGGKLKFLTFIDVIIQASYFTISLINDFVGSNEIAPKKMPKIRKIKDHLLASLAFPCAMIVGVVFWGLMVIDRELIFPKAFDAFFPGWLNHIMHTNIMVFIVLELFISFRQYPKRKDGLKTLVLFLFCYLIWIHIIKYVSDVWVYPILAVLDLQQRVIFFIGNLVFAVVVYLTGEFLNNQIWSRELKQINKKSKN